MKASQEATKTHPLLFLHEKLQKELFNFHKSNKQSSRITSFISLLLICSLFALMIPKFLPAQDTFNTLSETLVDDEDEKEEDTKLQNIQAKILKLEVLTDLPSLQEQTFYVGQYITIAYRLTLHDDARIVYTEFNPSLEQNTKQKKSPNTQLPSIQLIEKGQWEKQEDEYISHYTFKILNTKAIIPSLVVHVQNNYLQDSMQTEAITLQAQSLKSNPFYCGVVASNLKIVDYTLENYDNKDNMILIELEGIKSNLEDFKLQNIKEQEFGQGTRFNHESARASVLAKIPHDMTDIKFSYYNVNKRDFVTLSIPNTANLAIHEEDIKEDLNPKSSFFRFFNISILVLLGWFLLMTIIKRSYFSATMACFLFGVLVYRIFSNTYSITTLPNTKVLIQPTRNSTELFTIPSSTKLEAIDKKNNYYKVNIDSKVGWISHNDTKQ